VQALQAAPAAAERGRGEAAALRLRCRPRLPAWLLRCSWMVQSWCTSLPIAAPLPHPQLAMGLKPR
jgi:hypothetical protein